MGQHADDAINDIFKTLNIIDQFNKGLLSEQDLYDLGLCDEMGEIPMELIVPETKALDNFKKIFEDL